MYYPPFAKTISDSFMSRIICRWAFTPAKLWKARWAKDRMDPINSSRKDGERDMPNHGTAFIKRDNRQNHVK